MRTTLDLNETLMAELMQVTQAKTKTEAIHFAMTDLIRRKKINRLKALSGTTRSTGCRSAAYETPPNLNMVIIDTSVWIAFFSPPALP